jgi:DNA-directed RNA polymerase subunit beta'
MVKKIHFKNQIFSKKELKNVIYDAYTDYGIKRASSLADEMKEIGFHYATKAGISISIEDLKIPPSKKNLLFFANKEITNSDLAYARGEITSVERFQKVLDTWNKASESLKNNLVDYFRQTDPLNSIYLMAFSGARGNLSQVRQLVGMRGLMSDPNGQIIDIPIIHNFREGLTITDYIMSAYGARKGVVDTALRTADSGYLTRRLIDVAQDVIIREQDCFTERSIKFYKKDNNLSFLEKIIGRTSADNIYSRNGLNFIVQKNQQITEKMARMIINENLISLKLHSPLTCESSRSICQKCYGWNLAYGKLVGLGEAVGIIAAQSIGEPGTQLTMRTFHTGGIFTADPSRQVRAKETGFFSFNSNLQANLTRTMYGRNILNIERESDFTIIDYKNTLTKFKLPADSSLFLRNRSFVTMGDLIAELPTKNKQTINSQKTILSSRSGEVTFLSNSDIVWILEGEVYTTPKNSLLNKFHLNKKIGLEDNLITFKIPTRKDGLINIIKNKNTIDLIKITKCLQLINFPIFWDKKIKKLIINKTKNELYIVDTLTNNFKEKSLSFALSLNKKYKTETGGQLFYPNKTFIKYNEILKKEIIITNTKILFIPVETHIIKKDKSLLLVSNRVKLKEVGTELLKGIFSKTDGFLQTKISNNVLYEIQIKPGNFFEYNNLPNEFIEKLKKLNKKIFFPGEIIFDDILVPYLTLIEITKTKNYYGIILRPIQQFNIPKPKNFCVTDFNLNKSILIGLFSQLKYKLNSKKYKKNSLNLIDSYLYLKTNDDKINSKKDFIFRLIPNNQTKQEFNLGLMVEQAIDIPNFLSKKLNDETLKLSLWVKNLEYIEKNSLVGKVAIEPPKDLIIRNIKNGILKIPQTLIITEENHKTYYSENTDFLCKKNDMIRLNDQISRTIKVDCSGKVIKINPFSLTIHKGTPFFLTSETKLYKRSGQFIKKNELLGVINFEQIVTGDIVQGLPKIEEIFEARKQQGVAILNHYPGIISKIDKLSNISILRNNSLAFVQPSKEDKKVLKDGANYIVKKNDYIFLGQALTEGSINPHNLLSTYFEYYKNYCDDYESAYLSFKNIQLLLIQKVQQVYNSQGVDIADKHLEVILRRMTSKVKIKATGDSLFLPDDIIDLKEIEYVNNILKKYKKKNLATYDPILLGITKASLLADSFISAASFQETTKILTRAAIEGKIDWLRGLKENVIIGRLIPVGTGFRE